MNVYLAGIGYWGMNVLRNLQKFDGITIGIIEPDFYKWSKIRGDIDMFESMDEAVNDGGADAIIICTPISTHPKLVLDCLNSGKHVLCQKPVFRTVAELEEVIKLQNRTTLLMAAHTFLFHPAVQNIKENLVQIGKVNYYKSTRINLGVFNRNNNVIDDLAPHDLSILCYLFPDEIIDYISATGTSNIKSELIDTANITIKYKSGLMANIDLSWVSAVKNRQIIIVGEKQTIVYDDCKTENKVCYYDAGVNYDENSLFNYRKGDMTSPRLEETEAIYNELKHFIDCVLHRKDPITGIDHITKVTKLLETANISIKNNGQPEYYN